MPSLQELPLPLAIMVAAFWFINQNNAEFASKLVTLIAAFDEKYNAIIKQLFEERATWNAQQQEHYRQVIELARDSTEAHIKNADETHKLRNVSQQIYGELQQFIHQNSRGQGSGSSRAKRDPSGGGGKPDATDR